MIKLIAIDLDGTFLSSEKTVLPENCKAVQDCLKKGIEVVVCTGRTLPGVRRFLPQIFPVETRSHLILQNGAAIHRLEDEGLYWGKFQSSKQLIGLCDYFFSNRPNNCQLVAFDQEHLFLIEDKQPSHFVESDAKTLATSITPISRDQLIEKEDIFKMMVLGPKESLDAWGQSIPLRIRTMFDVVRSQPVIIEFLSPLTNKASALAYLCHQLGIDQENVMAIGDEENDREMLDWAKYSVAMGNASEEIKAVTQFVTATNDQAGVAQIIRQLILGTSI